MHAVAIGPFNQSQTDVLTSAAERAGVEIDVYQSLAEARQQHGSGVPDPGCVIAVCDDGLSAVVRWVRGRDGWYNMPVLAFIPHPSESAFKDAFSAGADDAVLGHDLTGLQRRIVNLHNNDPAARPPAKEGVALVASANACHRRNLGKVLRQAGFEVAFASEARDLMEISDASRPPTLVVATPSFPPLGGAAAVRTVRTAARNPSLPAIVVDEAVGTATEVGGTNQGMQKVGDVKGKLLFFAEEALRGQPAKDQRASQRLHFATICAFRMAGMMEPTYGLTHNISREGLFIRTLDPPPAGSDIWFEMRTFDDATVHLRGKVVWRRELGSVGGTTPPGIGVRIDAVHSPSDDLDRYVRSYANLLRHRASVN